MAEEPTIGSQSRWFRVAVLFSILFVLSVTMLAVGAIDTPNSKGPGSGPGDGNGSSVAGDASPQELSNSSRSNGQESGSENGSNAEQNTSDQGEVPDSEQNESDQEQEETNSERSSGGVSSYGGTSGGGYPEQSTVGGQIELSNQPELRIESPRPARWRLGGYDQYTGSGWGRDSNPEPIRGPLEAVDPEASRPQYAVRAEALRPFGSLATVWRPAFAETDRDVFVTDQRGLVVDRQVESNETYTTVTYGPPDRSKAKTVTDDAPPPVQQRYTQLPSNTPDRLGAITNEITADTDTPYAAAQAVERWLKQNKQYSLDAAHDRGNDVATEFVFEMEAGYCQYFATAMTAMLRTQDIPTRYVTGYTTGEQVDENTYLVRGKNAHAWVEVYFDGVGWVTFDPTPGGGRIDAGRSVQSPENQEQSDSEEENSTQEDQEEQDSTQEDQEQNDSEQDEDSDQDAEIPSPPYEITLSPDPVPGTEVTVTVEKNDTAVPNVQVSFNEEVVGTTDDAGRIRATVPYATELIVSARPTSEQATMATQRRLVAGGARMTGSGTLSAPLPAVQTDENSSVRYEIPTEVTVETDNLSIPGGVAAANMSLNGTAIANLDVVVDGETVGTTDETGSFALPVPADAALGEELSVQFTREDFIAEGSISVADVEIEIDSGLLKLPGTDAEITVTAVDGDQDVPLQEIPVRTNNAGVTGVTGADGTATMILPWSNEATATAVVGEQTVRTSISGILLQLLGVLAVPVVVLAGGAIWLYRNPKIVRRFTRGVVGVLVTAGEWTRLLGHRIYAVGPALISGFRRVASRVRHYFARLRDGITLALLLSPVYYAIERVTSLIAWIGALPARLRDLLLNRSPEQTGGGKSGAGTAESTETGDSYRDVSAYRRLQQCWQWLVRRVFRRSETKTAVEVEEQAVEQGFPRRPVRRLRRAFQDVEYGFADPDDRVDAAEESVDRLREESEEGDR